MDDFVLVQNFKPMEQLKCYFPYKSLFEALAKVLLKPCVDLALKIASISVLHDHTQALVFIVKEGALVAYYIWNVY